VLARGTPKLLCFDTRRRFGCSGSIEILVEPAPDDVLRELRDCLHERRNCDIATVFEDNELLRTQIASESVAPGAFVHTIELTLRLIIIGEGPDAIALRADAALLSRETIVIEAIPQLSEVPEVPDERTAAVVATHNFGRDAAGSSSRLGQSKQLLDFNGETLVRSAVRAAIDGGCEIVCVVTGAEREAVKKAVADFHPLVLHNEEWRRGMGSSIRSGVQ
jgi:hypothetical protein